MKKFLVLLALLFLNISFGQQNITTYYLIRHAEKVDNSQNPDLSETGLKRANQWNTIFSEISFDEIYSTDYKRTIQTASPTATVKNIQIKLCRVIQSLTRNAHCLCRCISRTISSSLIHWHFGERLQ